MRGILMPLVLLLSSAPISAHTSASGPAQSLAFVDVNVVPMDADRVLRGQIVLVENGVIKTMGASIPVPQGTPIVDGHGTAFLSPGLSDMHTHSDTTEDLVVYLANAVTTVLNMGEARSEFVARDRPAVNRGDIPGPHVYLSFLVDGTPQYGHFIVTNADEARALVRLAKTNGYDFIKVYNNLFPACFNALVDESRTRRMAVIGHGLSQVGIERQLAAGQLLVAHTEEFLYTTFAEGGPEQTDGSPGVDRIPGALAFIKRYGAFVTADLNTFAAIARQWGRPAVVEEFMRMPEIRYLAPERRIAWPSGGYKTRKGDLSAKLAFLKTFTRALSEAGVPLVTGTDAPTIPGLVPGFSLHQDLRALEQAGLTRFQALSAATRVPGDFIRKAIPGGEPFGTIAPGHRADLILSAENPLDDLSTLQKPLGVMARGDWYTASDLLSLLDGVARKYDTRGRVD